MGGLAAGALILMLGIPCLVLGIYQKGHPPDKGQKKPKKRRQTGKLKKQGEKPKGAPWKSLVVGGILFSIIGTGLIVMHFLKG